MVAPLSSVLTVRLLQMVDLMVGGGKTVMAAPQFGFDDQTVADAEEKQ